MNFLNRLKYYLVGVGLGILMVMAIFKDRKLTNWTPQNQVRQEITEKEFIISEDKLCAFACGEIHSKDSVQSFIASGSVNFKKSNVKDHDARIYLFEFEDQIISEVQVLILTLTESVEVLEVSLPNVDCDCP